MEQVRTRGQIPPPADAMLVALGNKLDALSAELAALENEKADSLLPDRSTRRRVNRRDGAQPVGSADRRTLSTA